MISVTRWLDYFFNFWLFTTMKVCHFDKMFAKVDLQIFQILNKPSKDCQRVLKILAKWLNFAKSGHTAEEFYIKNVNIKTTTCLSTMAAFMMSRQFLSTVVKRLPSSGICAMMSGDPKMGS